MTIFLPCSEPCCCNSYWRGDEEIVISPKADAGSIITVGAGSAWPEGMGPRFRGDDRRETLVGRGALTRCRPFLHELALEVEDARGQFVVVRLQQEGVEAAAMVNGLEGVGRDAQPHRAPKR